MKIDKIKYYKGRPYIEYKIKSGRQKGSICKFYGQIIICQNCNKKAFASGTSIRQGNGKFCSPSCSLQLENNPNYKTGKTRCNGYIQVKKPDHPQANIRGYVYEHRIIVEKQIGRYLHTLEVIHHVNKIKTDNNPKNLMAFRNDPLHLKFQSGIKINSKDIIFDGRKLAFTY